MVDEHAVESIREEIGRKMDVLRSPDDDSLREPIAWARDAAEQVERVMKDVEVLDVGGFAEVNFKLPSPTGAKPSRDIMSHMGFRTDGLNEFTIRYPRVSEDEADKEEVIAVGESVVDRADAREYVNRVRINEGGIGGSEYWLHIQGRGLDDDTHIEDIMPLLREAADAMGNRVFDARGLRAPVTRADFRTRETKRLYDRLSEMADIASVDVFGDGEAMIEFYAPDQDPHYPSALAVNSNGNLLEMTLRLGPLGIRDETPRQAQQSIEADWADIVLDAASSAGILDELDLTGRNIDLGDEWIAPQLRPHVRINDREDAQDRAYNVGWREITDFLENVFEGFERTFGTLEERRFDPDFPGAFEGDDRDMMRAPSPVAVPDPFEQVNMMGGRESVVLDFDAPGTGRRLPSTVVYDDEGVTESSLRLPRLDAPEQTRNVKRRVKMLVRDTNPPIDSIDQQILRLGEGEPGISDTLLIRFRDNGDSLDPHIEFDRTADGPRIDPAAMLDFYARVFEAFRREYDMADKMQAPAASVRRAATEAEGVARAADNLSDTRLREVPYAGSDGYAVEFEMDGDPPTTIGRNRYTSISFNEDGVTDITLRLPQAPDAYFERDEVEELTERLRDKYNLDPAFVRFQPLVTESFIPHIEAEKMDPGAVGLGPVEVVEAATDLLAEYNRELDKMFAPEGGMRAPEMGKFDTEGDFPDEVLEFAETAEQQGYRQVDLNNFPRQDRQTVQWSFRPIADDVLMPGVISALSVSNDGAVDEYTVRLPTLDGDKLPGSVSDAERTMEMVANEVVEESDFPQVIRVRVRTNPQPHNSKVGLTPHIEMWGGGVPFEQVADAILDAQEDYYDAVEETFSIDLDRSDGEIPDTNLFAPEPPGLY